MSTEPENTKVSQVDIELADILGSPNGANTIVQKQNNFFKKEESTPLSAAQLEKEIADEKAELEAKAQEEAKKAAELAAKKKETGSAGAAAEEEESEEDIEGNVLDLITSEDEDEETKKAKGGSPKLTKDVMVKVTEKLIKEGKFVPFDDEKPLSDYTVDEFAELIEENFKHRENKVKEEVPVAFFDSLPEEFQQAFTYFQNGGNDIKGILAQLSRTTQLRDLDDKSDEGQEEIARVYLTMTGFGTAEEIDEEINGWKDRNELAKKAGQFKPKLDDIQQKDIQKKLKAQEVARKQAEKTSADYMDTIYNTLAPGELAGIKLDKKIQGALYNGLVQPNYQSAFNGQPINEFGYLLEQKQFGKDKDLEAVALAHWILKDKEGFLAKVREQGGTEKAKQVAKKLKVEEQSRTSSSSYQDEDENAGRGTQKKLKRANNIFK